MNFAHRRMGILLHPTSLPGPHGSGDLGPAAYRWVDWLATAGQAWWQWLPNNAVGPGHSPYQSTSAFAGGPHLVALEPLVDQGWLPAADCPVAPESETRKVDYCRMLPARIAALRLAFAGFAERAVAEDRRRFAQWSAREGHWLDDYALFMALDTAHAGRCWWEWPALLRDRDAGALAAARREHAAEIGFWCFVQWCFDEQASALKQYANARGVFLLGDLPIFIAHHSADCWARPDLYELDADRQPTVVAGVPPDDLGPDGQRWGNPLYNWQAMAADDYRWWVGRMRRCLALADGCRIDHFRGFAGYYEIPAANDHAREGRWVAGPGAPLFDAIHAALGKVAVIAEDLGYITDDVHALRAHCGYPGMKILQQAFGQDGMHEFLPHHYERNTVVYTGTHDNDTTQGWWDHARDNERAFARRYLGGMVEGVEGAAWALMRVAAQSIANTAIFPLQDVLKRDASHRMNRPGTVGDNWDWRFVESDILPEATQFLRDLVDTTGRAA